MMRRRILQTIGALGVIACLAIFISEPSFPTPDKLLVFLTFVFMIFGKAEEMLKHLVPFVAILLVYESFRGLIPKLNSHVNYTWMPRADRWLFRSLPTAKLQSWLWHGHVRWYDFVFYLAYMLHFILPIILLLLVWKFCESKYWQVVANYLVVSFAAFFTFLFFPAAPPWMASDMGLIPHITRVSSNVWFALGLENFPSVYSKISPNPVAAVPSLHAAYATLFAIFATKLFKTRWRWLAWIYPVLIYVGTVYQGEHYAIDEIIGIIYAVAFYLFLAWLWPKLPELKKKVLAVVLRPVQPQPKA